MTSDGNTPPLAQTYETSQAYMQQAERYNRWIADQFIPHVKPGGSLLEIGCGTGNVFALLAAPARRVGVDVEQNLVDAAKRRFAGAPGCEFHCVNLFERGAAHPLLNEQFDTVTSENVLEHIEDDAHALRVIRAMMKPDGRFCLLVPAMPSIYGRLDAQTGHFRRYTKRGLRSLILAQGFELRSIYYMNLAGAFGWWLSNRITRHVTEMGGQARLFNKFVPLFRLWEDRLPVPFGQSLVAVCNKGGGA